MFAVTCLLPSVLYLPEIWQIQHTWANTARCSLSSVQYGNKSTLSLLSRPRKVQ